MTAAAVPRAPLDGMRAAVGACVHVCMCVPHTSSDCVLACACTTGRRARAHWRRARTRRCHVPPPIPPAATSKQRRTNDTAASSGPVAQYAHCVASSTPGCFGWRLPCARKWHPHNPDRKSCHEVATCCEHACRVNRVCPLTSPNKRRSSRTHTHTSTRCYYVTSKRTGTHEYTKWRAAGNMST